MGDQYLKDSLTIERLAREIGTLQAKLQFAEIALDKEIKRRIQAESREQADCGGTLQCPGCQDCEVNKHHHLYEDCDVNKHQGGW